MTSDSEAGDEFADLYRAHFTRLVRIAYLLSDSAAAAEDAVHEAFIRCAPRLGTIDHPPSYLRAAVLNECRTVQCRRSRTRLYPVADQSDDLPYDLLETRAALSRLSPKKRAAVVLRYFVDIPDDEIAEILDCRPATVRTLLHRAMKDLKKDLA